MFGGIFCWILAVVFFIIPFRSNDSAHALAYIIVASIFFTVGVRSFVKAKADAKTDAKTHEEQILNEEIRQREQEKLREKAAADAQKKTVLEKIYSNGIDALDTSTQKENALFIAKNLGMTGSDDEILRELSSYFAEDKRQKAQERQKKEQAEYQKLLETYNREKKLAYIAGKDKYLLLLADKAEHWKAQIHEIRNVRSLVQQNANAASTPVKKVDPYIAGGIAQGLAGTAAGLFTAANVEQQNQQRQQEAAQRDADFRALLSQASSIIDKLLTKTIDYAERLENATKPVREALLDEREPEKYFDQIIFDEVKIENVSANVMKLRISTSVPNPQKIVNTPAQIDGSVHVVIVENGEDIGDAYYSAYGAGDNNLCNVGFASNVNQQRYTPDSITVLPFAGRSFAVDRQYALRIEPVHIWKIESIRNTYWEHIQDASKKNAFTSLDEPSEAQGVWGRFCRGLSYEMVAEAVDKLPSVNAAEVLNIPPRAIDNIHS